MKQMPVQGTASGPALALQAELRAGREKAVNFRRSPLALVFVGASLIALQEAQAQRPEAQDVSASTLEAVSRDLSLTSQQARDRIEAERAAVLIREALQATLVGTYAGAWFDPDALELVVATTDPERTAEILDNGARPMLAERSMRELNDIWRQVDQAVLQLSEDRRESIWSWGIDIKTNSVTITIPADDPEALTIAQDVVALSGADTDAIRIEESTEGPPRLYQDIYLARGGDEYLNTTDSGFCSVGFGVGGGYVTAGHCSGAPATTGDLTEGYNGESQGTFNLSEYPTHDRAWVGVTAGNWSPVGCVGVVVDRNCEATGNVEIHGSVEAIVGNTVCRYGRTTGGPWCGEILATEQSVNFGHGIVNHMVATDACAEPGDSGGPFVFGNDGQGTVTGGSGNCTFGGTTYYYPLNRSLTHFNVTLKTISGPTPATPSSISTNPPFQSSGSYSVVWPASSGATQYFVQRTEVNTGGGVWTNLGSVPASPFYTSAPAGEYQHRVMACNSTGCSGWRTGAWLLVCTQWPGCVP